MRMPPAFFYVPGHRDSQHWVPQMLHHLSGWCAVLYVAVSGRGSHQGPGLCSVATVRRSWYRRTGGVWGVGCSLRCHVLRALWLHACSVGGSYHVSRVSLDG